MSDDLKPDTDEAIRFLEWLRPAGPWLLSAKLPDGPFETRHCADIDTAREWIQARNGRSNLYVMLNPAMTAVNKKAKKADVAEVAFLHVDLDVKQGPLEEGLDRIRTTLAGFEPRPSGVIFSGGGYWAFWRLDEPLSVGGAEAQIAAAESYNRQLEAVLGGDHCHNVDRVCRLPGTINLPDEAKRTRGRTAARASIMELTKRDYPLHEFTAAPEGRTPKGTAAASPAQRDGVQSLNDPAELDAWNVPLWTRAVIVEGSDPTDPNRWGGDRSKAVYAVVCQLARCRTPPGLIVGIVTDETWGISAHIHAQKNPLEYAWRQVERACREVEAEGEPFQTDKDGKRLANQHNVRLALTKMGVSVRFDTFADRQTIDGLPGFGPHLDDAAMSRLWLRVIEEHHIKVSKDFFWTVVEDAARRDAFHPVVEYLGGLEWDGVERLDRWMAVYLDADDTEYTRHVGAIMLTAAVRRVRRPGCKFDEMACCRFCGRLVKLIRPSFRTRPG